ncbi:MAG: TIGR00645 family protein [Salinisphaera sp.]|jgi:uncharacterized protein (TIGR00645 family)|nr:TIGR00645 family protein [Salinisphaera sp.]
MKEQSPDKSLWAERLIENIIFRSRWLLAPFYLGLVLGLVALLIRFGLELYPLLSATLQPESGSIILGVLHLIDLSLVANLVLVIMFSGYESFVSRIDSASDDRPTWMGKIDFSGLKIKLMASMAAISGIYLLEALLKLPSQTTTMLAWKVGIHLTFVVSGVLFALMDWIESRAKHNENEH